jgi:NhaA family Na+:H+ antiporter
MLLLLAGVTAMLWANSPWASSYDHFWETILGGSAALGQ